MLALLACTCPGFQDMTVTTPDGGVSDVAVETVEATLAEFAAWTGAEGVCVPEIEVRMELAEPLFLDADWEVGGVYYGPNRPIRVKEMDAPQLSVNTRHELCHALDDIVGWSTTEADLIEDRADRSLYPDEDAAKREDFAELCQWGFGDVSVATTIAMMCSTDTPDSGSLFAEPSEFDSAETRLLAFDVFPDAPRLIPSWDTLPATSEALTWTPIVPGEALEGVTGLGHTVYALVRTTEDEAGVSTLELRPFDAELQSAGPAWTIWSGSRLKGVLIQRDTGIGVLARTQDEALESTYTFLALDPTTETLSQVDGNQLAEARGGVVVGELQYFLRSASTLLDRRTADGVLLPFDSPMGRLWPTPSAFWPVPGGVGMVDQGMLLTLTDAGLTLRRGPETAQGAVTLPDGRLMLTGASSDRAIVDTPDGWRLIGNPCQAAPYDTLQFGEYASLSDRLLTFDVPAYPPDDDDHDGVLPFSAFRVQIGE